MVPGRIAERVERERSRQRAKEARRPPRNHHGKDYVFQRDKPFIAWDGEGPKNAGYALLGNSLGMEICYPFLRTRDCLELLLGTEYENPNAIHIGFGFNYDVSNMLRELSWRHLSALKHWNRTEWEGYEIEHIPNKWFLVKRGGVVCKLFDIRNYFGTAYVPSLQALGIGTEDEIQRLTSEKARRSEFLWSEIDDIRNYFRLELRLMPLLAEKLRETFLDSGFDCRSWHGPGTLANMAMRTHGVRNAMARSPVDVQKAAQLAFAGGRFEMPRGGWVRRKIYCADIHSAYPAFARSLPNLTRGRWRHGRDYEHGKFAMYRIRYHSRPDPLRIYPLFRRLPGGDVVWTHDTEGWFWSPEAELVAEDSDATFLESLIFDEEDETDRPFAWLEEYYRKRQYLKSIGSVLELTFKLIINSVYGQLAQRTGWDRKNRIAPKSHQLEWAGYITSACRAAIYRVANSCGNDLVSIDTDGITSMAPFPKGTLDIGDNLGQWELDEYDSGIFWQSGIYALERNGEWIKGKTRGIMKGTYTPEQIIESFKAEKPLTMNRKSFIGYGLALNGRRAELNTWVTEPVEVVFGGQGKRYHNEVLWCGKRGCKDGVHDFIARPVRWNPSDTVESTAHSLPWSGPDPLAESRKRIISDLVLYDGSNLTEEEREWVLDYA
jgi:hypothetical protein